MVLCSVSLNTLRIDDDKGIIWPTSVAPFQVHIVSLGTNRPVLVEAAEALYGRMTDAGFEVLYDDRVESAGVKFNDADLIGIPVRLTISPRTMQRGSLEIRPRWSDEAHMVPEADVEVAIREMLASQP